MASRDIMVSVILSPFSLLNVLDIFLWMTNSLISLSAWLFVGSISGCSMHVNHCFVPFWMVVASFFSFVYLFAMLTNDCIFLMHSL